MRHVGSDRLRGAAARIGTIPRGQRAASRIRTAAPHVPARQVTTLIRGHAAPDPVPFARLQRPAEAFGPHRAGQARLFRDLGHLARVRPVSDRVEDVGLHARACGAPHPVGSGHGRYPDHRRAHGGCRNTTWGMGPTVRSRVTQIASATVRHGRPVLAVSSVALMPALCASARRSNCSSFKRSPPTMRARPWRAPSNRVSPCPRALL